MRKAGVLLVLLLLALPATARADWSGDGPGDVLGVNAAGSLVIYRGNGAGKWATGTQEPLAAGWGAYTALLTPGDFSGDGHPDLLARDADGRLLMFRGNGAGAFAGSPQVIGSGWARFTSLFSPGDFSGDGLPDVIARDTDGKLLMYRGDGDGGWITGKAEEIGSGWGQFNSVLPGGDFSGDGHPDVLAVKPDGALLMYRGNGTGRWVTGQAEQIGSGWAPFTALLSGGDFNGDGKADILARASGGELYLYRGDGAGGFLQPIHEQIGSGWSSLSLLTLAPSSPPPASTPAPPAPAPEPGPAPAAPVPNGNVTLDAGIRCTPPGGLLRVSVKIRKRAGRPAPRVQRIVFYVRKGPRRTDHHRPYAVHLRMHQAAGAKGRVYARVYFRRAGTKKLHTKTVSRRFVMCS
jgi:hypothetical protein